MSAPSAAQSPTHLTRSPSARRGQLAKIQPRAPDVGALLLSQDVETRHAVDLLSGGHTGVGYLLKERIMRAEELVDAVRRVAEGGTAIDPEVVRIVFGPRAARMPSPASPPKEREVLALVAEAYSNDRIAMRLDVTARTVESHTSRIFTKLGLEADPATHRRVLAVLAHLRVGSSHS